MEKLTIKTDTRGGATVLTVGGRIDSETAPAFDAELGKALGGNAKLVIDFKGVDYMSSAGLRAVVKAAQTAEQGGGSIRLAAVPEAITSVMYTVGLDQKINSYASVDEAVASF
jgi:anti-anti-sigma factor